jgi:alkylated DNA repair protein (DNA oxidative demethylase)
MADLFTQGRGSASNEPQVLNLGHGIFHIKHLACSEPCLKLIDEITQKAPMRHMMTPMGYPTKASMSNCGSYGWVSDLNGYRYSELDPITQKPWPDLPHEFLKIHQSACQLANIPSFLPDACLINRYEIGQAMGRHKDKDEKDTSWPIVSISFGLSAVFEVYPDKLETKPMRILLEDGDVLILSSPSRLWGHGVKPIKPDLLQPNLTTRYNLTLRRSH